LFRKEIEAPVGGLSYSALNIWITQRQMAGLLLNEEAMWTEFGVA
jgi:hypothetical protein